MINYCVVSGTVIDGGGNPVPNASIIFNPLTPQVVQGQYIQPIILNSLTGDDGDMIPIALPWGILVQITVNNAAPFMCVVPSIGAVHFGSLAMNAWPVLQFQPTTFFFLEDFPPSTTVSGSVGTNGWSSYPFGAAPTFTLLTAEQDHPGIARLLTTAVTGQGGTLAASTSPAVHLTYGLINNDNWQANLTFRLNQVTDVRFLAGLVDNFAVGPSTTYLGIRFDTTAPDAHFQFVASNGGGADITLGDTGIPGDTAWHTLQMSVAKAGFILFSLDYGAPTTIGTNLPSGGLTPAFQLLTAANAMKSLDMDYFAFATPALDR